MVIVLRGGELRKVTTVNRCLGSNGYPGGKYRDCPSFGNSESLISPLSLSPRDSGRQIFHGHVVLLVNRHTISGAEIVAQFAKEHGLAVIVGERTAGRSLSFGTFQLPHEFRFTLPIGDYVPWSGSRFEGDGIEPDVATRFRPSRDNETDEELGTAMEIARSEKTLRQYAG